MHDTVIPLLYQDPIINNYDAFYTTIVESPESLKHIRRLRLCHGQTVTPESYRLYLDKGGWGKCRTVRAVRVIAAEVEAMKKVAGELSRQYSLDRQITSVEDDIKGESEVMDENKGSGDESEKEKEKEKKQSDQVPPSPSTLTMCKLEKVVIQPEPPAKWGCESKPSTYSPTNQELLSVFLINYPTVDHFCQPCILSELALDKGLTKLTHPPKVFTVHIPILPGRTFFLNHGFPIILGAVNRIMFEPTTIEMTMLEVGISEKIQLMGHIRFIWSEEVTVVDDRSGSTQLQPIPDEWIEGTTVELYGLVGFPLPLHKSVHPVVDDIFLAAAVEKVQEHLDDVLSGVNTPINGSFNPSIRGQRWKGKVVIKTAKEAPPCTACGLVLDEHRRS